MSAEKIEASVQRVARAVADLARAFERAPQSAEATAKAFTYLSMAMNGARVRALGAITGPAGKFTLDMMLPAHAPTASLPDYHAGPQPAAPAYPPGARAPTRSGLTVEQLGGRLTREARNAAPAPTAVAGAEFIDDDEDAPSSTDDDVDFVDD